MSEDEDTLPSARGPLFGLDRARPSRRLAPSPVVPRTVRHRLALAWLRFRWNLALWMRRLSSRLAP